MLNFCLNQHDFSHNPGRLHVISCPRNSIYFLGIVNDMRVAVNSHMKIESLPEKLKKAWEVLVKFVHQTAMNRHTEPNLTTIINCKCPDQRRGGLKNRRGKVVK